MKDGQRLANERYIVQPEDIKGDIEGFPLEIVQWMVDEQVRQGNRPDVEVFQRLKNTGQGNGGINFDKTELGHFEFWRIVNGLNGNSKTQWRNEAYRTF